MDLCFNLELRYVAMFYCSVIYIIWNYNGDTIYMIIFAYSESKLTCHIIVVLLKGLKGRKNVGKRSKRSEKS